MHATNTDQTEQAKLGNAFTVINNVRDYCQQPDVKRWLLLILATYSDGKGICWPSNRKLMRVTGKSERTIRRMLRQLEATGEIKVLSSGAGHKQKRILSLSRYVKPAITVTPLNRPRSLGEMSLNNHSEQPTPLTEYSHHRALRAADAEDSFSKYVEEEKVTLRLYHQYFSDVDDLWLPVLKYSDRVREALELLPDLETAKLFFDAVRFLVNNGEDYSRLTWKPTGDTFECYLPAPNKRTGKRTLVRLLQCNRDEIATIADITATYEPPDMLDDIPI
jgi:hypothetical protein